MGALTSLCFPFHILFIKVNCNLYIVRYLGEGRFQCIGYDYTAFVWTAWTLMFAVPKRPLNLITHSITSSNASAFGMDSKFVYWSPTSNGTSLIPYIDLIVSQTNFLVGRKWSLLPGQSWHRTLQHLGTLTTWLTFTSLQVALLNALNENCCILIDISLKRIPCGAIDKSPPLF